MQQQNRPTKKELDGKLRGAKEAIESGNRFFAEPAKVSGDLNDLDLGDSKEVWDLILKLLPEISDTDYDGKHPPEKSYERAVEGKEFFPFCWDSKIMGKKMYLKFVLSEGTFYYLSLHKSKF